MKPWLSQTEARKRRAIAAKVDLHAHTHAAIDHKLQVAEESVDWNDAESIADWTPAIASLKHAVGVPTITTLSKEPLAQRELADYVCNDLDNDERRMILRDLCRSGYFPVKTPGAVTLGAPIATIQVDGKHYEVGSYD